MSNDSGAQMTNEKQPDEVGKGETLANGQAEEAEPFRIVGSLKLLVSPEELEAGIAEERRRQAVLSEAKMRSILE